MGNTTVYSSDCGWGGDFQSLLGASIPETVNSLSAFVRDSSPEQIRAWNASIPLVQVEAGKVIAVQNLARDYGAIFEYKMPFSSRRADLVLLVSGAILVIELKGDGNARPEHLEQVADYARSIYSNHALCGADGPRVHALVVSYGLRGSESRDHWITTTNISRLHDEIARFDRPSESRPLAMADFLNPANHQPAPSLVQAVRAYFSKKELPRIKRIDEVTGGALKAVITEIKDAYSLKRRKLILVGGVPGAGKTYVGLQVAHEHFLDGLSEVMDSGLKPSAPAVFLSGNKPLVEVLQYEMRQAGGDGKVFVQNVKSFVEKYSSRKHSSPPHHVMIFDEAQRAWDAKRVQDKHGDPSAVSEPESFVQFAGRVPGWSAVIALIGEGQEIYTGEEGGMQLWAQAALSGGGQWDVVGPAKYEEYFARLGVNYTSDDNLYLSRSVRFHFASGLSKWAEGVVSGDVPAGTLAAIADGLRIQGYQLRITRNLPRAKRFLQEKYQHQPEARFGLLTGGRDKGLVDMDINKVDTRTFRAGPWYADPESSASSCRRLYDAVTEFSAQGLELDHALLAWGTDFIRKGAKWDDSLAMKYQNKGSVINPLQLRKNAYRVLLTRGREGVLICLPQQLPELDESYDFLVAAGCEVLSVT
jgi:hypothetical protein